MKFPPSLLSTQKPDTLFYSLSWSNNTWNSRGPFPQATFEPVLQHSDPLTLSNFLNSTLPEHINAKANVREEQPRTGSVTDERRALLHRGVKPNPTRDASKPGVLRCGRNKHRRGVSASCWHSSACRRRRGVRARCCTSSILLRARRLLSRRQIIRTA